MSATSFTLILSLYFMQQEVGTAVRAEHLPPITDIATKTMCEDGKRAWLADHNRVAIEPTGDWETPDSDPKATQPKKDRFELVVPIATCVQVR